MMANRFALMLLLLCLAPFAPLLAQQTDADKKLFEQTKAKADKGDRDAEFSLGNLYASGTGVSQSPTKAYKWHRKAAEHGLARAQYQLAIDYASGTGVKPDPVEAVRWLTKAAEQDHVEAQLELGLANLRGEGALENSVEAARWFRKAADKGNREAVYELGKCYLDGTGVTKDIEEGIKLIRRAAERGCPPAQNRFAQCYEKGIGLPKDGVEAYKWFNLAAAQDDKLAVDIRVNLSKLESSLTPEQVARAQKLAREFKPVSASTPGSPPASNSPGSTPGSKTGEVNVLADNETSEISVDGSFVGNPPARLKLNEGPHVIEVKRKGFENYRREVTVTAGSELTLRVVLTKQGATK